jgi:hypothetical protein
MNNKNSAIFLATVLVAGIIGISSPLAASAQEYGGYDKEYKKDDPYKEKDEKKYGNGGPAYLSAKCDNTNVNINGIAQTQAQQQDQSNNFDNEEATELNGQEMTPEEALNALNGNGNGEPLLNIERNIVNVCINENDNELDAEFFPFQAQGQIDVPINTN